MKKLGEIDFSELDSIKLSDCKFTELDIRKTIDECRIRGLEGYNQMDMMPVPGQLSADVEKLRTQIESKRHEGKLPTDFPIRYDGMVFRVSVIQDINGEVYSLRQIETESIDTHSCGLHEKIRRSIIGKRSGLIIISGPFRSGKTTLSAAVIREWLIENGGKVVTLEDPPEALLSGQHGKSGICYQVMMDRGRIEEEVEVHARSTYDMLFIGEIRGSKMAAAATMASANGGLILTTYHSDSVTDTITRWLADASNEMGMEDARGLLSRSLAGVLHMKHRPDKPPTLDSFLLPDQGDGIRARIKSGELPSLEQDVRTQRNLLALGKLF